MTGNEDLTVQFGEDPPWDDLPPVDREKANKELESRLIFDSWTCRFCGGTFADRTLAIKHAIDCDDNEDVQAHQRRLFADWSTALVRLRKEDLCQVRTDG